MRTLLAALAALTLLLAGCAGSGERRPADDPATGAPDGESDAPEVSGAIDWREQRGEAVLPNGWRVAFCEGDAPVLCVTDGGETVGTVDLGRYPAEAGLTLDARIEDYLANLEQDRTQACPDHGFTAAPAAEASLGGLTGLQYGFTLTAPDGAVTEQVIGWMAERGEEVFVLTVDARDPDGCPGPVEASLLTPAQLEEAAEPLARVAADLVLPDPEVGDRALSDGEHVVLVSGRDVKGGLVALDPVTWLGGEEANAAARQDGVVATGETVPNDYYARNPEKEQRWLSLDPEADIRLVDCERDGCQSTRRATVAAFLNGQAKPMNGDGAFFDVTVEEGVVVKLVERYVP